VIVDGERDAILLGDVATRIVRSIKPVDVAKRIKRKRADDEAIVPSLPKARTAIRRGREASASVR
jgi:hypothetical protein